MNDRSFLFTIFFVLIGPIKVIPAFARLTAGADLRFRREAAIKAALAATAICLFITFAGESFVRKYHISIEALDLAAGLILLISALRGVFPRAEPKIETEVRPTAGQLALSPLATPVIVAPAGVAALLIFALVAPENPGMLETILLAAGVMMVLDFLVMFFNHRILGLPGLMPVLQLLGSVLVVVQVALALQVLVSAFRALGAFG